MINYKSIWIQYALLFLMAAIWGSSFILMKRGLETFSSEEVAYIRMVSASLILVPIGIRYIRLLNTKNVWIFLVSGLLGNGIPAILFTTAQTHITSSLAGMLNVFVPVLTLLIGFIFFSVEIKKHQILGIILGFIGVIGLLSFKSHISLDSELLYVGLVLLATLCYALNINVLKRYLSSYTGLQISSLVFITIAPIFIVLLLRTSFMEHIQTSKDVVNLGYITILGVIGTAFATILFNNLLKITSPVFASSVTYIIPIVAVFWGLRDGEYISVWQYASMATILIGILAINHGKIGEGRKEEN